MYEVNEKKKNRERGYHTVEKIVMLYLCGKKNISRVNGI